MFREKVGRDVALVKDKAAVVVAIEGEEVKVTYNPRPALGIIAIIGPGQARDYHFSEAVLDEISIGESRPYHQAKLPLKMRRDGESPNITYRRRDFSLTSEQYLLVAPTVFRILQELADQRVGSRECGPWNSYQVHSPVSHYSRKGRRLSEWVGKRSVLGASGFAVSVDSLFLPDIYQAELNFNIFLRRFLDGLAKFTDLCLEHRRKDWRGKKNFWDLKKVSKVMNIIKRKKLPLYLLVELMGYLPGGQKNKFWQDLGNFFGWGGDQTPEREISCLALPDPKSRVGDVQIRVTTGLEAAKDHIVVEVLHSAYIKQVRGTLSNRPISPSLWREELALSREEMDALPF
jgi:hypothetical protein